MYDLLIIWFGISAEDAAVIDDYFMVSLKMKKPEA